MGKAYVALVIYSFQLLTQQLLASSPKKDPILASSGHSSRQLHSQVFEFSFQPRFLEAEKRHNPIDTRILVNAALRVLQ